MSNHITKAFDADLQDLNRMVAEMGGLAEQQIAEAVDALAKRDTERAKRVIAADDAVFGYPEVPHGRVAAITMVGLQSIVPARVGASCST